MANTEIVDFVINRKAGTVLAEGEKEVERSLRKIFEERAGNFYFVDGEELAEKVRWWLTENDRRPPGEKRGLIVGGGDGSLKTAASIMKGTGSTLGFLPLGTQNFIATNMGFAREFRAAARQFLTATTREMDVGNINGHDFLVGAVFGDAVKFFEAREDLRERNFLSFAANAASFASGILWGSKNTLMVGATDDDLEEHVGRLFAVTANAMVPRSSEGLLPIPSNFPKIAENAFGKALEPDGQLVFYGSKAGIRRAPDIISEIWSGTWDRGGNVSVVKGKGLVIDAPKGIALGPQRIVLDGELLDLNFPVRLSIAPRALKVYAPSVGPA
jgi:diacylglycerol kinase family enzyme